MWSWPEDPCTAYALRVCSGEVIAGPHVRDACARHLRDLVNGHERGLVWDTEKVDRVIRFFEKELTIEVEEWDEVEQEMISIPKAFEVHESQAFILGSLFGWFKNGIRRFRRAYIEIGKGNGKAISLDEMIPTPDGWKRFGDIRPGDYVFHQSGKPVRVIAETPVVSDQPCYEMEFSCGGRVVVNAEHLWNTAALRNGEPKGPKPADAPRTGDYTVKTTRKIAETLLCGPSTSKHPQAKYNHRVDVAAPLELPERPLPAPPYTFGVWLGDGDSDCARITMHHDDFPEVESGVLEDGFRCSSQKQRYRSGLLGFGLYLRATGAFKNKHIPEEYLRASYTQRLALLQGVMDTDGYIDKGGRCELTQCNERLAMDCVALIRTLGLKPMWTETAATLKGKEVGRRWRITFTAYSDQPVFRLKRKYERQKERPKTRPISLGRMVTACRPVDPVPVKCITIDHPDGMFLIGENLIPTHNSPLAAGIGHYMLTAQGKIRAEVYSAATDKDQASILFRDAVEMYRRSPNLASRLITSGHNPVWQLTYPKNSSYFKPISSEKKGKSGIRPFCALIDEVHEHPNNEVIEMMRAGTKGNQSALIFEITNSGNSRESVCWDEHEYSIKIASGEEENDAWLSYICALDEEDDPFEDESCWIKANPLMGVSIFPDFVREQVEEARGMPSKEALVRRLHFCQWTEGAEGWITRDVWMKCEAELDISEYEGMECYGGLDLSYTKDLSAFSLAFPVGGTEQDKPELDVFVWFWKPTEGLQEAVRDDRVPYDVWAREGHLNLTEGRVIRLEPVAQLMSELADRFNLRTIAYDNYRHRELEDNMYDLGIELPMTEHPQGFRRTESSRLWMPNSVQDIENGIIEGRIRFRINPLLRYNVAQTVVREDPAGTDNRIFDKKKSRARIDGIVACAMAVGAAVVREEPAFGPSLSSIMVDMED